MTRKIGRPINFSDTASVEDFVEITGDVAVIASAADSDRAFWAVTIISKDAYIRYIPAATDNSTRKGIFLKKDQTFTMDEDNWYFGEISIINKKNNEKPEYSITSF